MRRHHLIPLLSFVFLAIALRWGSFFISVINHDESTYIVIADELLRGERYLRDVIDTKPIGIFWIYALLIKLTGGSIFALRLAAAAVVGLGGWLCARVATGVTGLRVSGYVAAATYILACSVFKYYGVSPNTEIFFNVFSLAAVALTVASSTKRWLPAGLLLGCGFVIKPFIAAEALAVGLYLVWFFRHDWAAVLRQGLLLVGGFLLPVGAVVGYFTLHGLGPQLWFYSVEVAGAYPIEMPWYLRLKYQADYLLRYAPFLVAGAVALGQGKFGSRHRHWFGYLLLQFLLVSTVVLLTGKRFGHYQIQLHPVVALFFGTTAGYYWADFFRRRWVGGVFLAVALGIGTAHAAYYARKPDEPRKITAFLRPLLGPGETYFAVNGFQISYHLLDRPVPTPYVHSSLLFYDHHVAAFAIDEEREARRIIDDPSVRYLVGRTEDSETDSAFARALLRYFEPYATLDGGLRVWIRSTY